MKIGMRMKSLTGVLLLMVTGTAIVGVRSHKVPPSAISTLGAQTEEIVNEPFLRFQKGRVQFGFYDSNGTWQSSESGSRTLTILYFWSSWCQPCEEMTGWMNRLWHQYGGSELRMAVVALDTEPDTVERTVRAQKIDIPFVFLEKEIITRARLVSGAPMIVVIAPQGRMIKRFEGVIDEKVFESQLSKWLHDK